MTVMRPGGLRLARLASKGLLLVCLLLPALLLPACGDDDSESKPLRVVMTDEGYQPRELTVPVGSEVTFVNRSTDSPHTAKDEAPGPVDHSPQPGPTKHDGSEVNRASHKGFATHALFPDEAQRVVFPVVDAYDFHCAFHSEMTGRIKVVE